MYFSILFSGRLGNQLFILYHLYNTHHNINKLYAPHFKPYCDYFNMSNKNILCDDTFYYEHQNEFTEIKFADLSYPENYFDLKFHDLKLKDGYNNKIKDILDEFVGFDLIGVHIRNTDYINFHSGKYFFDASKYLSVCYDMIKKWNLTKYKILIFSDEPQNIEKSDDIILTYEMTNFNASIDLHMMSFCNYFITTYSTFSGMAGTLSKNLKIYKNSFLIE